MKRILYITLIFAAIMGTISFLGIDMKFSSLFYHKGINPEWIFSNNVLWQFFYKKGEYLPNLCGVTAGFIFILGLLWRPLKRFRIKTAFVVFLLLIAPTLIVQTLKITWGRPRPVETTTFGGKYEFREFYNPNPKLFWSKKDGNSFPSGHAAIGFYMIFVSYLIRRRWVFGLGALYGVLMGMGRVIQGAHFLSDIVTSFFIVYITAEILDMLILHKEHRV
ncbi:MAG: phosphatase PAP2 family protein [Pseudomonadota bacterium]